MHVLAHQIHLNLTLSVELEVAVSFEPALDQFPELGREGRVEEVMDTKTRSRGLGRVSGSDTLPGSANGRATKLNLLETINDLVETHDEMSPIRDKEPTGNLEAFSLKRVELIEKRRDMNDNTRANERGALRIDQPCNS